MLQLGVLGPPVLVGAAGDVGVFAVEVIDRVGVFVEQHVPDLVAVAAVGFDLVDAGGIVVQPAHRRVGRRDGLGCGPDQHVNVFVVDDVGAHDVFSVSDGDRTGAGRCGVRSDRWGGLVNPEEAAPGAAGFSARARRRASAVGGLPLGRKGHPVRVARCGCGLSGPGPRSVMLGAPLTAKEGEGLRISATGRWPLRVARAPPPAMSAKQRGPRPITAPRALRRRCPPGRGRLAG